MDFEDRLEVEIQTSQRKDIDASGIWELFESAAPEQRVIVFQRALEAGVLDDEYAFEFLNTMRGDCDPTKSEDRAHYTELLDGFRKQAPKLFQRSSIYYHRDLINFAIIEGRWDGIPELLTPYTSGDYLDIFIMVIAQLKYHGQIRPLITAMKQAWPKIKDSPEYVEWASEEFAGQLMELMLVDYLENSPDPHPDDPELTKSTAFLLPWKEGWLEWFVPTVAQPEPGDWSRTDFFAGAGSEALMDQVNTLLVEFIATQRRAGIPLSRGLMAWQKWSQILRTQTKTSRKSRKKRGIPDLSGLLIPRSDRIDEILGKSFSLIGGEPFEAVAALELIPAYLNFLEGLGLIQPTERHHALRKIKPLVEAVPRLIEYYEGDPVAIENLLNVWAIEDRPYE